MCPLGLRLGHPLTGSRYVRPGAPVCLAVHPDLRLSGADYRRARIRQSCRWPRPFRRRYPASDFLCAAPHGRVLADLPADNWGVRTAETAFALTGLYLLLRVAQAMLMSLVDDQTRAPKLVFDIVRIGLSVIWGSVMVSSIWKVNLGSIFAAMGVGSIALAFALQEFLGNLLSGMGLLSAHKFGIGDWIMVDGKAAEVRRDGLAHGYADNSPRRESGG